MKTYLLNILALFLLIILVFCSCKSTTNKDFSYTPNNELVDSLFTVNKIDSVNKYYLVYLKKNKNWYKIVSKKEDAINFKKIKINSNYKFSLKSIWNQEVLIGSVNVSSSVTPNLTCLTFDKETSICIERDSINDLFITKNLKGLYYIKNN